ncbi:MAG: primosomal protein N' [Eubacteriales bacterium]|nr:primosomal protein N' [Eubacteriales bacterium]
MRTDNCLIASVAVEGTVYHFDKAFDYAVPSEYSDAVKPGCRVKVPFARGNNHRQGMVMSLHNGSGEGLKFISELLDNEPILPSCMLSLAEFMKRNYYCTLYEAVKAMLPAGINYNIVTVYEAVKGIDTEALSEEEQKIYTFLQKKKSPVKRQELMTAFGLSDFSPLEKMVQKNLLKKSDDAFRKIGDKSQKMLRLSPKSADFAGTLTEKQQSVFDLLVSIGEVSVKEICYYTGVTTAVVDAIVKKGIAEYFDCEVFRTPTTEKAEKLEFPKLSNEQDRAYRGIKSLYDEHKGAVALLYGVTGSGKTAVFTELIRNVVGEGKGVILMVPEIALTPQLVGKLKGLFGDDVAIFHSGLSLGERLDEYKRVKMGLAKIAVGTRSAVFAPFENLGLIVMDEEQEHTYKSENKPRFHARDVAKFRCAKENALLLLSSATPDIESYYFAGAGRYSLFSLSSRFGTAQLPDVITADMNVEIESGNTTGFSSLLLTEIEENLKNHEQTILLLNRRGYNTFAVCKSCKEPITCPNCSISLTYHKENSRLMCHYCGFSQPVSNECPACHEHSLRFSGSGTQRAEETLAELFPNARILRMDADTVMTKNAHEKHLSAFSRGEYDILIGTQMVAKGLDFPGVTLVGVMSADQILYSDDYRSFERAFSMLTQVVGRSGRGDKKGRAVVQTLTPENPVIELATKQDYEAFYKDEIELRKLLAYPPFSDLLLVGFLSEEKSKAVACANEFLECLKLKCTGEFTDLPIRVLGPSPALVSKVNNKYRYKIIIKSRNNKRFRELISGLLTDFGKNKEYQNVTVYADLKPLNF